MHQTFYIDIDEEITSIVDRLRKAKAREVIIVVPKRALLIQSIVNLKLLKKEADNLRKDLVIVTQDKLGKLLVEKTGIAVQQKLDDIESEEMAPRNAVSGNRNIDVEFIASEEDDYKAHAKNRLEMMGTAEYFEEAPSKRKMNRTFKAEEVEPAEEEPLKPEEKIVNKELVTDIGVEIKKGANKKRSGSLDMVKNIDIKQSGLADLPDSEETDSATGLAGLGAEALAQAGREKRAAVNFDQENFAGRKNERIGSFFREEAKPKYRPQPARPDYGKVNLSGKFWKYFAIFGFIGALIIILAGAYLFLPKVDIKLFVNAKTQSVDAQVKGDVNQTAVDADAQVIPAQVVSADDQLTETYPVTGSTAATGQKAHGTITIYNEYSSSTQPLIATTRFQSPDGKIFRLVKSVVVPGMTNVGGQAQPGAIEADVIADEAGDSYNIDPTTFTIPGFKDNGNDKYSKFYAKSFKAMAGGGNSNGTANAISATDITNAKNKTLADLTQALKQKLKSSAGSGAMILDDASNIGDATYAVSNSAGEIVNSFTVTVKAKATAIAFNEQDLKDVLEKDITKAGSSADQIDENSLVLQYGKSDTDFTQNTILIRVNATGKINPNINIENLKKGILGKSEDDFRAYLKTYPAVEKAEINYWPSFLTGKIPAYESRVNVELDNN